MDNDANQGACKRFCFALLHGARNDRLGILNRAVFDRFQQQLHGLSIQATDKVELDIWLDSPGGSASVAYKLLLEARNRFSKIRVVVPDYAKSAATLLSIGADEIYMAPAAELGPLDVQIEHPDREGVQISGLDASRALGFLAQFAIDYINEGGYQMLQATKLPRRVVVREFSNFAANMLEPLVAKLDPQLIHRAAQDLDLGTQYAAILLGLRNPANCEEEIPAPQINPKALAEHFVEDYPAHEYVISRDEARSLGLPVRPMEEYDKREAAWQLYNAYQSGVFQHGASNHFVQLIAFDELDKLMATLSKRENEELDNENGESNEDVDEKDAQ